MTPIPSLATAQALILAPHGRDAALAGALLREAGIGSHLCRDMPDLQDRLNEDAWFVVVTEEAARAADLRPVAAWVAGQPSWSDLAFIILTRRGASPEPSLGARPLSDLLGNVTFLERPFHPMTFVSVAGSAVKGRLRQFEARARIEALHESEERLRTALLAGRLGTWELDLTTWTLTASATCKTLSGRPADGPFSYQDLVDSIHPDDVARTREAMRVSLLKGTDYAVEYRIVWPDGSVHWAEVRARVVTDLTGVGPRLVGVTSDITDRKAAEENLRLLNETLEQRVAERTAELTRAHADVLAEIEQRERAEEQLRQAQKMELIGQLTGGVAHDFNNLLMAVLANLDLLRKHVPPDPRTARLIDGAERGARRGAALTQRLLAFARRQELKVEPRSLIDLVIGMTELIQRSVGPGIELRIELPKTLPPALVDANQLELALLNLVVNARDAMPEGGTLTIEADLAAASGDDGLPAGSYIRLTVTDTGHGMDAGTLKKATEPFFSTKEVGKGTGLGLSMIEGLALQLNGALRLSSEVGRGTVAELWLPATTVAAVPERTEAAEPGTVETPSATILVVDDDILIAMSTADMLEDLGHTVIEASSGAKAIEILRNGRHIDLLITDYAMPQMTGADLAKAARALKPDLPILLATGYGELPAEADIDLPRLGKPYHQQQLAAEIAKVLRRAPAA